MLRKVSQMGLQSRVSTLPLIIGRRVDAQSGGVPLWFRGAFQQPLVFLDFRLAHDVHRSRYSSRLDETREVGPLVRKAGTREPAVEAVRGILSESASSEWR